MMFQCYVTVMFMCSKSHLGFYLLLPGICEKAEAGEENLSNAKSAHVLTV